MVEDVPAVEAFLTIRVVENQREEDDVSRYQRVSNRRGLNRRDKYPGGRKNCLPMIVGSMSQQVMSIGRGASLDQHRNITCYSYLAYYRSTW